MDERRDGIRDSNIFVSQLIKLWPRRAKKNSNYGPKELGVEFTLRNEINNKATSKKMQSLCNRGKPDCLKPTLDR